MGLRSCSCLWLLMLLLPTALTQSCPTDPCVTDCTNCALNQMVADPENCHGFYMCDGSGNPLNLPFECRDGEVFNSTSHECEKGDSCDPCSSSGPCSYECPSGATAPTNIPSPNDCHNYYVCNVDGTIASSEICGASLPFFDGVECQSDETRCCHCHAYCYSTEDPGIIADPLDCRRYYLCTAADLSMGPTISGQCDKGENFDSLLQACSASAPCITQCTNVVGADGCIEPFTCMAEGFFARCPGQCSPDYYHCTEANGKYQEAEACEGGLVYHPTSHTCISPEKCP